MPTGDQPRLQQNVVLDDAIMDQRDPAGFVLVRMRIWLRDAAVRRPARMPEADRALWQRCLRQPDLADMLLNFKPNAVANGDPPRVVATIFESFERGKGHPRHINLRLRAPDIAENSAHSLFPFHAHDDTTHTAVWPLNRAGSGKKGTHRTAIVGSLTPPVFSVRDDRVSRGATRRNLRTAPASSPGHLLDRAWRYEPIVPFPNQRTRASLRSAQRRVKPPHCLIRNLTIAESLPHE